MAIPAINNFSSYILTDEEQLEGQKLTITQTQVIQNLMSSYAEEKLHLTVDPNNTIVFIQQEADLKGKIEVLNYLLDLSDASKANPEVTM